MKVFVNYKLNLLVSNLKSRGLLKTLQRIFRKWVYSLKGLPTYLNIEITNRCNLHCPLCAASRNLMKDNNKDMSFDSFKKIIDDLSSCKNYFPTIQLAFRGEPFLNKDIFRIIKYATEKNFFVNVNSNGLLLNEENNKQLMASNLNYLVISLDGATKDTYESVRQGGSFEDLIKNIENLVELKERSRSKLPFIELQCVITKNTEKELDGFIKLGKRLLVDNIKFKTCKIHCLNRDNGSLQALSSYLPKDNKYSRYKVINGKIIYKEKRRTCGWANDCLVYSDGDVGSCCEDFNKIHSGGNVIKNNFWVVWNSNSYVNLRKKIKNCGLDICKKCS